MFNPYCVDFHIPFDDRLSSRRTGERGQVVVRHRVRLSSLFHFLHFLPVEQPFLYFWLRQAANVRSSNSHLTCRTLKKKIGPIFS